MHLKKKNCESLVGTIMNIKGKGKDHENARDDPEEMGIHPKLCNRKDLHVTATTMYIKEKKKLCQFLQSVKFASGYGSNFARLVSMKELKLNFAMMKSHDYHVLMTLILPVVISNVLLVKVRETVMGL